jgi:hypothetical protein
LLDRAAERPGTGGALAWATWGNRVGAVAPCRVTGTSPARPKQARSVYQFTVDVGDEVPVLVGPMRSWSPANGFVPAHQRGGSAAVR